MEEKNEIKEVKNNEEKVEETKKKFSLIGWIDKHPRIAVAVTTVLTGVAAGFAGYAICAACDGEDYIDVEGDVKDLENDQNQDVETVEF